MKRAREADEAARAAVPLRLQRGESVVLVGFAVVRVLRGVLWVHGARLEAGREQLLCSSPEAGSTLVLEAPEDGSGCEAELREVERPEGMPPPPPPPPLPGPCRAPEGAPAAFQLLPLDSPAAGRATALPACWRAACAELGACAARGGRLVALVCGPKAAGKSTLARLAVNCLLSRVPRVQLLDADCGQPELTPPGLLSLALLREPLLGPPALRAAGAAAPQPAQLRFVGEESPKGDPAAYSAALRSLLAAAAADEAPLVVNTQGWVKGLGRELLEALCADAAPTHVLQLRGEGGGGGLPPAPFWPRPQPRPRCLQLAAAAAPGGGAGARSAADARALLWAAWAHRAAAAAQPAGLGARSDAAWAQLWAPGGGGEAAALAAAAAALCAAPPLRAPLARLRAEPPAAAARPAAAQLRSLNGALVALAAEGEAGACLGLALVRSVDGAALYLLTPLPLAAAAAASRLLLGRLALPAALLRAPGLCSPQLTHLALAAEGSGGGAMRSRNNLQRGGGGAREEG